MSLKRSALLCLGSITTLAVILTPCAAMAQDSDRIPGLASLGLFPLMLIVILYIYMSLAVQTIADKTNTQNAWLAWIPIANIFLLVNIAQKPVWWFILFLIPLVNLVIAIIVWMAIAERRGRPSWWGIMLIVPIMNLIMPGYLAWAN